MPRKTTGTSGFQPRTVTFPKGTNATHLGKNGSWLCSGILITHEKEVGPTSKNGNRHFVEAIRISPLTTRGKPGKCFIEVPLGAIQPMRKALLQALKGSKGWKKPRKKQPGTALQGYRP